jgi:radical SAM superfamily enzyme
MPLTLEANDVRVIKWNIDAAFAVHPNMKGHTRGNMTLDKGSIYGTLTRQKINTHSSTEAELVSVNNVMLQVLWTRYFLSAQGYDTMENIIYQDNQSAILLKKNLVRVSVAREPAILTFNIFSLLTELRPRRSLWSIVLLGI